MVHSYLGKVFISHSSADKAFVRKLNKRLRRSGFETWLDDHELLAGDALSSRIAEGVRDSRAVLVVASAASVESSWLSYELNLATTRMVQGECRVIPVVMDDADLPAEVLGLLYADFRTEFKHGYRSVLTALQHENTRAEAQSAFWVVARQLVHSELGGVGTKSLLWDYAHRDYEIVEVETSTTKQQTTVLFETVSSYRQPADPLDENWWQDFRSHMDQVPERLFLVITERPVAFQVIRPDTAFPVVSYREFSAESAGVYAYAVFVDLGALGREEWKNVIERAKTILAELAVKVSMLTKRPNEPIWPETLTVKIFKDK